VLLLPNCLSSCHEPPQPLRQQRQHAGGCGDDAAQVYTGEGALRFRTAACRKRVRRIAIGKAPGDTRLSLGLTTDSPVMDTDRMVATPGVPASARSTGRDTARSPPRTLGRVAGDRHHLRVLHVREDLDRQVEDRGHADDQQRIFRLF
jgi:hypothetical protein